jgi:hypothetical protein
MNRSLLLLAVFMTAPSLSAQSGHSYTGVHEHIDITGLNGSDSFLHHNRIAGAGDVNGDGVEDFLVGVPGSKAGKGKATLYSGVRLNDSPWFTELWTETGSRGYGGAPADGFGSGMCALGDINEDGYDDFAVSSGTGRYVMVYLGPEGTMLQALVNHNPKASDNYGSALAAVDMDGDGINELVVGDPNWEANGTTEKGMIEVYQFTPFNTPGMNNNGGGGGGSGSGEPNSTVVSILRFVNEAGSGEFSTPDMDVTLVAILAGQNENWFGSSLTGVATGTGSDLLLVGSPRMETSLSGAVAGGEVFLYVDNPATPEFDLEQVLTIQDTYTSTEPGKFGISVAAIGDIDGNDGVEEFLVGAPATDITQIDCGYAKVFDVYGNTVMTINGTVADEGVGGTVARLGDIDGDMIDDMLIAAPGVTAGPGYVTIISGDDASVLDTFNGSENSARFGDSVASSGDVDGDGSRDIIISRHSDNAFASTVHVFRPLHSLPYRISVDASGTGTHFGPVHGVNHGPRHMSAWTKWIGTDDPYLTNITVDYSALYDSANIPNSRIHGEGVGDMNYMWLLDQGILDDMSRDYDVSDTEIENLANYDFSQMDNRMDSQEAIPNSETIWRVGHDKAEIPGDTEWYAGFRDPPNSMDGFAKVTAQMLKHYNEGWGGRAVPDQKLHLIELWNEPYINFWTGNGTQFGELHVAMLKALDENFDVDGDGKADDYLMMTPIPPGDPDGWTTEFMDVLEQNWDPQNPHKIRIDGAIQHWYTTIPHSFLNKYEGLDTFYKAIGESHHALKQGPNGEVVLPEIWITEWNRTIEKYADTFASMPFLMNSFYYMDGLYNQDFKRKDGKDFGITFGGANFFSAKLMLWRKLIDPLTAEVYLMKDHAGLAWEVYGNTLFETASERLATTGSFFEQNMDWGLVTDNPIKDFTVMSGRSETEDRVVIVISSMQLVDNLDHPDDRDETSRLPYVVDVDDLGFTPVTITRYVQQTDNILFESGMEAALEAIPVGGSGTLPYAAWNIAIDGTTINIDVDDMIQNTYEVIIIEG